jgi:hypothetical protein
VTGLWREKPGARLTAKEIDTLFDDLGSIDARRGQGAVWKLVAAAEPSVRDWQARLRPARPVAPAHIARLIADLDSDSFEAAGELERLEGRAEAALRQALTAMPSPEIRRRAEALLDGLEAGVNPAALRAGRVAAILEHVGTPGARRVLEALAAGAAEARLTQEAKAALGRLAKRAEGR